MKRDPVYESITLTEEEVEEAIYEGKVKKFFHQKAVKNGVSWDTKDPRFGKEVETKPIKPKN